MTDGGGQNVLYYSSFRGIPDQIGSVIDYFFSLKSCFEWCQLLFECYSTAVQQYLTNIF